MAVRVAINGFGRIGRLVFRAAMEARRKDIVFVAINDLGSPEANAHLLKHDSVHGPYPGTVKAMKSAIKVDGNKIAVLAERDPAKLPWDKLGADVVMECSGHPSAGPEGIEFLRDGGTYIEMGQFTDAGSIDTNWHRFCTKDLILLGSWAFTADDVADRGDARLRRQPGFDIDRGLGAEGARQP